MRRSASLPPYLLGLTPPGASLVRGYCYYRGGSAAKEKLVNLKSMMSLPRLCDDSIEELQQNKEQRYYHEEANHDI
jgi:hypothetical protein